MELFAALWELGWHERVARLRHSSYSALIECLEIAWAGQNAGADTITRECIRELHRRVA